MAENNQYPEKKKWKGSVGVVLAQNLFYNWKFQLKISVKTSAKAIGLLSLFFSFFLLYSRAILSFSLSPSLLLCHFHCFNCWIILEKIVLLKVHWFSFHFFFLSLVIACLLVSLFVSFQIGNWKGGLVPSIEEFQSRSEGPTTLKAIGLRSTPDWVNHQRENNHQNWGLFCNFVICNLLTFIAFKFCNKKAFHWKCVGSLQ